MERDERREQVRKDALAEWNTFIAEASAATPLTDDEVNCWLLRLEPSLRASMQAPSHEMFARCVSHSSRRTSSGRKPRMR